MPSGLWDALGAALSQGTRTYGDLTEQENIQKARQAQLQQEQQRLALAKEQEAREAQRQQFDMIQKAIEGVGPGDEAPEGLLEKAKPFNLGGRFAPKQIGGESFKLGNANPGDDINVGTAIKELVTPSRTAMVKTASAKDQEDALKLSDAKRGSDAEAQFRAFMAGDGAKSSYDDQLKKALSLGLSAPPMSGAEFDRRERVKGDQDVRVASVRARAVGGGTPNTDALVQAIKEDPSIFAGLSKPAQAKLAPALAAAGFDFKQPPTPANPYNVERMQRVLEDVKGLKGAVSNWTVGAGSMLKGIPATSAKDFGAKLDTLKANIAFNELAEMRAASKTGGALGQVSDKESQLLSAALGALDQAQSPDQFTEQLQKIEDSVARWNAAKSGLGGGAGMPQGRSNFSIKDAQTAAQPPTPAGPKKGERRTINGVPAVWDGQGWLPVRNGG